MTDKHMQHEDRPAEVDLGTLHLPTGYAQDTGHHGHQKSFTSTRTALHRGQKIKIRTTYRIEIDGEPLTLHTMVLDDGTVHCHGLPNYSFPSAIDLARSIIDASRLAPIERNELGMGHDDHDGHADHGGHS
ncbi:hypothetical protein [uncultured Ruegeria sp.]|uniref:hypothetical protein n=1 Tax=uncultured Ruegeria sp. TaxID=259304 RepID=UPI0026088F63|nr:hypothetical protein [uncultured Ruegeria sp.]